MRYCSFTVSTYVELAVFTDMKIEPFKKYLFEVPEHEAYVKTCAAFLSACDISCLRLRSLESKHIQIYFLFCSCLWS